MTIGQNTTISTQVPSRVEINKLNAVQLATDNTRRTMLRIDLDFPTDTVGVIVGPTQAIVESLLGELIGQSFMGNDLRFVPSVIFTTDSAAQEQKWAIMLAGSVPATYELLVNEYLG